MRLSITQGNLTAGSRDASAAAASVTNADDKSIKSGLIVLKREDRQKIINVMNDARAQFQSNTLLWDEGGYRLCPLRNYATLKSMLEEQEVNFTEAVESLLARYNALKADYEARVNGLAIENPFPSYDDLEWGFTFRWSAMPIANPLEGKLKYLDPDAAQNLQKAMQIAVQVRLGEAQKEIISRLSEKVQNLKDRVEAESPRIHDSLIGKLQAEVRILPNLNITGDPEITRLIERVRVELSSLDLNGLRNSRQYLAAAAESANSVLDDLRSYRA